MRLHLALVAVLLLVSGAIAQDVSVSMKATFPAPSIALEARYNTLVLLALCLVVCLAVRDRGL